MTLQLWGAEETYRFIGAYDHPVELVLYPQRIQLAGHVVVLPLYKDQFLFTRHRNRGIEWPGGKVEEHESSLQAAIREVGEETGGIAESMWIVGQYKVFEKDHFFLKNVYVATVSHIEGQKHLGTDTETWVLCDTDVRPQIDQGFSPLVCDPVFEYVRSAVLNER